MFVIFDTNLLFFKMAYAIVSRKSSMGSFSQQLIKSIILNISYILKGVPGNVYPIFCFDSATERSWRYKIKEAADIFSYKGNRKRDYPFDKNEVIKAMDIFKESINFKYGLMLHRAGMEGDDMIYVVNRIAQSMGMSSIIVSSDKDMMQLVKSRKHPYTCVLNSNQDKTIYYTAEGNNETNTDDYMDLFDDSKGIEQYVTDIEVQIDPNKHLFIKILTGDNSDSIPSVVRNTNDVIKKKGLGQVKASKVWEYFKCSDVQEKLLNPDFVKNVAKQILSQAGSLDHNMIEIVINNINTNIKMMMLHDSVYDSYIDLETLTTDIIADIDKWLKSVDNSDIMEWRQFGVLKDTAYGVESNNYIEYE